MLAAGAAITGLPFGGKGNKQIAQGWKDWSPRLRGLYDIAKPFDEVSMR